MPWYPGLRRAEPCSRRANSAGPLVSHSAGQPGVSQCEPPPCASQWELHDAAPCLTLLCCDGPGLGICMGLGSPAGAAEQERLRRDW